MFLVLTGCGFIKSDADGAAVIATFMIFGMSYDFINWHLLSFIFFTAAGLSVNSPAGKYDYPQEI